MRKRLALILGATLAVAFVGGSLAYLLEWGEEGATIKSLGDALWWAIVTQTTVGYGDRVVTTAGGKIVGVGVMFSGIALLSLFTATIASVFVERKIREEMGLTTIKLQKHTVICGWTHSARRILNLLNRISKNSRRLDVVLIGDLGEEEMVDLRNENQYLNLAFVRGDYSQESVLRRANIQQAETAIILADTEGRRGAGVGDERTIIAAYAINHVAPDVRICAELVDSSSEQHLRRINVEDLVVTGEYSSFLLGNAVYSRGILQLFKELLTFEKGNSVYNLKIPREYVGKTVGEYADYLKKNKRALLTAILIKEEGISLDAILRGEASDIDEFIRKKFQEAETNLLAAEKGSTRVVVNPDDDMVLENSHEAIVIARWEGGLPAA